MSLDWKQIESELYMSCVNRQQVVLVKGEGNWVWDDNGKKYLDLNNFSSYRRFFGSLLTGWKFS